MYVNKIFSVYMKCESPLRTFFLLAVILSIQAVCSVLLGQEDPEYCYPIYANTA